MAATDAQRKQNERDRKRASGLIVVQEWVYREDAGLLREYAAKLRKKRAKEKKGDME
jgi:hypothetical protein